MTPTSEIIVDGIVTRPAPETLLRMARKMWLSGISLDDAATLELCAGFWASSEQARQAQHMQAAKYLSQIAAWKASCEDAEQARQRAEARAERMRQAIYNCEMDPNGLMAFLSVEDLDWIAALTREEKP